MPNLQNKGQSTPLRVSDADAWRAGQAVSALTLRETDVIKLLSDDLACKGIAVKLCVSPRTVKLHMEHIRDKLQCETNHGAVAKWLREGGI